jgi:hypothetical protein
VGTFEDPLILEYIDGCDWKVERTFRYISSGPPHLIFVNAGFITDFASIPRFFWRLLPPVGRYGKAAVIHDYLYRTPTERVTRAEADAVFRDAMRGLGVNVVTRTVMWAAVRLFGRCAYTVRSARRAA